MNAATTAASHAAGRTGERLGAGISRCKNWWERL